MAQVTIKINGYAYTVGCEDGQETHLQEMAVTVDGRIDRLKAMPGSPRGEGRLLVLAALEMADELHDTAIEITSLRSGRPSPVPARQPVPPPPPRDTKRITMLAEKAESIAAGLDQA